MEDYFINDLIIEGDYFAHSGSSDELNILVSVESEEILTQFFGTDLVVAKTKFKEAIYKWNNLCPNVTITYSDDRRDDVLYCNVTFKDGTSEESVFGDAVGYTEGYNQNNVPLNIFSGDIAYTYVWVNFDKYHFQTASITERQHIITHELGHALYLTHPGRYVNTYSYAWSVMSSGMPNDGISERKLMEPGIFDACILNHKWGN